MKGCGYPPTVNCSSWLQMFGQNNSQFPCYYSGTTDLLSLTHIWTLVKYKSPESPDAPVITHLDVPGARRDVLLSILVPILVMIVSAGVLFILSSSKLEKMVVTKKNTEM